MGYSITQPLTAYTQACKMSLMAKEIEKQPPWDSQRIRTLRSHLGLTQRELARQLGTRQQTISEWEKGMYQPRGASSTLLSIVAERANFKYEATLSKKILKNQS